MRDEYIQNYVDGVFLGLSLDALWHHLSWEPSVENALTMTEWGPFFLTGNNAPFVPIFIRTADRALHHANNVWRQLAQDLSNARFAFKHLDNDSILGTNDRISTYEIEAFLGAVVGITELNLIGSKARNRLGQSHGLGAMLQARLKQEAVSFEALGIAKKWHQIRNSAYHLNPEMREWAVTASIRLDNKRYRVALEGVHYAEGASSDLVEVFTETYLAFLAFVVRVRDWLLEFSFVNIAVPTNNHYYWRSDLLGNMFAKLGPEGFEFRHFPETASDFVGAPRGSALRCAAHKSTA